MGRRKPYLVGSDADNRTSDKPYNGSVGVRVVENPFIETQPHIQRVTVTTSIRDVPLDRLHARKQIKEHQYAAGSRLQRLFELAEPGNVRAVEYKSAVQTSWQAVLPVTQQQMEAYDELKWLESQIGNFGLLRDVIRDRLFFNDIAPDSEYNRKILARLFRKALDDLSELMGLKGEAKPARAKRDRYSDMAKRAA